MENEKKDSETTADEALDRIRKTPQPSAQVTPQPVQSDEALERIRKTPEPPSYFRSCMKGCLIGAAIGGAITAYLSWGPEPAALVFSWRITLILAAIGAFQAYHNTLARRRALQVPERMSGAETWSVPFGVIVISFVATMALAITTKITWKLISGG